MVEVILSIASSDVYLLSSKKDGGASILLKTCAALMLCFFETWHGIAVQVFLCVMNDDGLTSTTRVAHLPTVMRHPPCLSLYHSFTHGASR